MRRRRCADKDDGGTRDDLLLGRSCAFAPHSVGLTALIATNPRANYVRQLPSFASRGVWTPAVTIRLVSVRDHKSAMSRLRGGAVKPHLSGAAERLVVDRQRAAQQPRRAARGATSRSPSRARSSWSPSRCRWPSTRRRRAADGDGGARRRDRARVARGVRRRRGLHVTRCSSSSCRRCSSSIPRGRRSSWSPGSCSAGCRRHRARPQPARQLLVAIGNAWFAVGPRARPRVAGTSTRRRWEHWPLLLARAGRRSSSATPSTGTVREWLVSACRRACSCA